MSSVEGNPPTFTCFPRLPLEIRLLVWECLLPLKPNLRIGWQVNNQFKLPQRVRGVKFWRSDQFYLHIWTEDSKIVTFQPPPENLFLACAESRRLVLFKGSLVPPYAHGFHHEQPTWLYRHIATVLMPLTEQALKRFRLLKCEVDAIATLWPSPEQLIKLHQTLNTRGTETGVPSVKTIYIGLSGTAPEAGLYVSNWAPRYEAEFQVLELGDENLAGILDTVLRTSYGQSGMVQAMYHRSVSCFLTHLKQYWEHDANAKELRSTWKTLTSGQDLQPPVLKPAIILCRTRWGISFGSCQDSHENEWSAGLMFKRQDAFRELPPVGDCTGVCRGRVSAVTGENTV